MNPLSASSKLLAMGSVLIRHPDDIRFAYRWLRSLLPSHSPLTDEIPWVTFKAIEWLESYLKPHMDVFEYGAGGSTLFLAKRASRVVSVEHDEEFYQVVAKQLTAGQMQNCELILRKPERMHPGDEPSEGSRNFASFQGKYRGLSFGDYVKAIDRYPDGSFDLVAVDGRARVSCVRHAIGKVRRGGYVLLDNSERPAYAEAFALLSRYRRQDMYGIVPWNLGTYQTSIWQID